MIAALLAIVTANSPLGPQYFRSLHFYVGPLSLQHWINDGLMSFFFLLVGLEIKREMLDGQLSSWSRRILPCAAALGGMLFPALFYVSFNWHDASALRGWAIPTATDIAFALGVISLLGSRVPMSLKIFLAALAISDDLGAVLVIALFYTTELDLLSLGAAALVVAGLVLFNRMKVNTLWPYLAFGFVLWIFVLASGIHATLAGVLLALTIPHWPAADVAEGRRAGSPLHRLEHALSKPVTLLVIPVFGFANAGISFDDLSMQVFAEPLTLGVAIGLAAGKFIGVLGTVTFLVKAGLAPLPEKASWGQMAGTALLCGIGFTMSLFVGMLAFDDPVVQNHVKIGILMGSVASGLLGASLLAFFCRDSLQKQAVT